MRMVGVWFKDDDVALIDRIVEARRETISTFVRRSVMAELARLSFLPGFDKKALQIERKGGNLSG